MAHSGHQQSTRFRQTRWRRQLALALLAFSATSAPVWAEDEAIAATPAAAPELLTAQEEAPAPETLDLRAPALPEGAAYRLEVDAIDVSARLETEAEGEGAVLLHFRPLKRMARGAHAISLFVERSGGSTERAGNWTIAVASRNGARLAVDTALNGNVRVASSEAIDRRFSGDGSVSPSGAFRLGELTARGNADVLLDSTGDPRKAELGDFQFSTETGPLTLRAGQQELPTSTQQNYLLDGSKRRGVSSHLAGTPWNLSLDSFLARSESLSGFRGGLGIGDAGRRITGGFIGATPIDSDTRRLSLHAGALQTRVTEDDGLDTEPVRNRTQSAGAEGRYGGFSLDTEFAHSSTAANEEGLKHSDGEAWRVGVGYEPAALEWRGHAFSGTAHVTHQRIDSRFDSRANYGLPVDEQRSVLNLEGRVDRFAAQLEVSRSNDNVDGLPIGRIGATLAGLQLSLAPAESETTPWYGAPTWSAGATTQRNEQLRANPDPELPAVDDRVDEYTLGVQFDYQSWNWGLNHRRQDVRNHADVALENSTDDTTLEVSAASWALGEKASLSPRASLIRSRDRSTADTTYLLQTGFGVQYQALTSLNLNFDASYSRSLSELGNVDEVQWLVSPSLTWQAPTILESQLSVTLSGNYQRARSGPSISESWAALLSFTLSLPWKYSHGPEIE